MSSCPLDEGCYSGNCIFCSQKEDCVLQIILKKVENLESIVRNYELKAV